MKSNKPIIGAIWEPTIAASPLLPSNFQIRNENCPNHRKANATGALIKPEMLPFDNSSFLIMKKIMYVSKAMLAEVNIPFML